jgi:hypothetical protein
MMQFKWRGLAGKQAVKRWDRMDWTGPAQFTNMVMNLQAV